MKRKKHRSPRPDLRGLWQLDQDSYAIRVQVNDPSGKRRNVKRTLYGVSLATAVAARDSIRTAVREGTPIPRWVEDAAEGRLSPLDAHRSTTTIGLPPLGDFVEQWLMRKKARGDLEVSTADRYATALDHLSPRLLRTPLDAITPDLIERWMLASTEDFAPSTINSWLGVLRAALNASELAVNPALKVAPLRVRPNLEEPNALPPRQLRALLATLEDVEPMMATVAWTLALTGLRWGEVTALKWGDVDEAEGVLWIRRKVVRGKLVPSTKTGKLRVVGAPEVLLERLREHRAAIEGTPGFESGLVFPSSKGTPLATSRMSEALKVARPKAGITQRFTAHGFRRSATDLLRRSRVDPVIAAAVIGHDTERMRRHYSTIRPDEARGASEAVAELLAAE